MYHVLYYVELDEDNVYVFVWPWLILDKIGGPPLEREIRWDSPKSFGRIPRTVKSFGRIPRNLKSFGRVPRTFDVSGKKNVQRWG